jgi:hypothetical protein
MSIVRQDGRTTFMGAPAAVQQHPFSLNPSVEPTRELSLADGPVIRRRRPKTKSKSNVKSKAKSKVKSKSKSKTGAAVKGSAAAKAKMAKLRAKKR